MKRLLKRLLKFLLNISSDYQTDTIKNNEETEELEKEIRDLEIEINSKLSHRRAKSFKNESVSEKSVFQLEKLRGEMKAKEASINENSIFLIAITVIFSIYSIIIVELGPNDYFKAKALFFLLLLAVLFYFILDGGFRKRVEHNRHIIELIDLLIERREKMGNY